MTDERFEEIIEVKCRECVECDAFCGDYICTECSGINRVEGIELQEFWQKIKELNDSSKSQLAELQKYQRANAEVCLLGITPSFKAKQYIKSHAVHQIIESPIEVHSKKPDIVRDKILELLGDLPRIELFARQQVGGWDCWGNEVDKLEAREKE